MTLIQATILPHWDHGNSFLSGLPAFSSANWSQSNLSKNHKFYNLITNNTSHSLLYSQRGFFYYHRRKPTKLLNMVCTTDCIFQRCLNNISQPTCFSYNVTVTLCPSRDRVCASSFKKTYSSWMFLPTEFSRKDTLWPQRLGHKRHRS